MKMDSDMQHVLFSNQSESRKLHFSTSSDGQALIVKTNFDMREEPKFMDELDRMLDVESMERRGFIECVGGVRGMVLTIPCYDRKPTMMVTVACAVFMDTIVTP